ncbi:MAG: AAA family ATPase [Planctomycetales bacterium]|nr:AAA family ATPase [Planctomycetales bacterium]
MYQTHWNLSQRPFENRADATFYYPAETHQAALLKLHYAIENRRAAAILCGSGGIGKSLVIDLIRHQLADEFRPICHIVFPAMSGEQLIRYVVDQVDAAAPDCQRETSADLARFERFLRASIDADRHPVIFVDEAHLLEQHDLLEPLRLMLNIAAADSPGESAWTLVLAGQPSLLSHVERYHALDERLSVKCMLNRLLPDESSAYIQHRMRCAGVEADSIFESAALDRIHMLSQGIPRRINRLCDLALMVGYAEDRNSISVEMIDSVHSDLATPTIV